MIRVYVTKSGYCVSSSQTDQHHSRTQFAERTVNGKPAYFVGAFARQQVGRKALRHAAKEVLSKYIVGKIPQLRYTKIAPPKPRRRRKAIQQQQTNELAVSLRADGNKAVIFWNL